MVIGITGGIGSGKSTICSALETIGYKVYYCDYRASYLMNNSDVIKHQLIDLFSEEVYKDGVVNKPFLASLIFNDADSLKAINSVVHPVVIADINQFIEVNSADKYLFVESAIIFESGVDVQMDKVITISAPLHIRIARVMKRDGASEQEVNRRIKAQMSDRDREIRSDAVVVSDDQKSTLLQLLRVLV